MSTGGLLGRWLRVLGWHGVIVTLTEPDFLITDTGSIIRPSCLADRSSMGTTTDSSITVILANFPGLLRAYIVCYTVSLINIRTEKQNNIHANVHTGRDGTVYLRFIAITMWKKLRTRGRIQRAPSFGRLVVVVL